ncbi:MULTISPECIES: hypothetical protein [unclassified Micromonospora]|uniref:hypothetical protein n=1 Tax=unclassified Micromonospora TaxID=2617518 RepID=UPI001C5D6943|nr:hypothetical protein [Micromonospora sp. RL09-050-HVF-A]MBW4702068.1 hypothetical protein [Micromonospora sp. RL09-050-HVF-A]
MRILTCVFSAATADFDPLRVELERLGHRADVVVSGELTRAAVAAACGALRARAVEPKIDVVLAWGTESLIFAALLALELGCPLAHSALEAPAAAGDGSRAWARLVYQSLPVDVHLLYTQSAVAEADRFGLAADAVRRVPVAGRSQVAGEVLAGCLAARVRYASRPARDGRSGGTRPMGVG